MKYFTASFSALAAALLLCSCASSERMMRLSPFENRQTVKYDDSTVNIWPMFYNNGAYSSALWPMIDSDAKGFAVRPFYNQDGKEYSILFPLSAWNPEKGNGWVFNAYWNIDNVGAFPLFHAGKDLNLYGPAWYMSSNKSFGFFPLYRQNNAANAWFFPLYLYNWKDQEQMILPLFGTLGMYYKSDDKYHYRAVNWFHTGSKNFTNNSVLPLYYYQEKEDEKLLITPLGGSGWNEKTGKNYLTDIGGPLFFRLDDKDQQYLSVMWPLYIQSFTPSSTAYGSIPLFWYKKYQKDNQTEMNVIWPLYSQNGAPSVINNNNHNFNILGPFIYMNSFSDYKEKRYAYDYEFRYDNYYAAMIFDYKTKKREETLMPMSNTINYSHGQYQEVESKLFHFLFFFEYGTRNFNAWSGNKKKLSELYSELHFLDFNYYDKYLKAQSKNKDDLKNLQQYEKAKNEDKIRRDKITALLQELKIDAPLPETITAAQELQRSLHDRYCQKVVQHNYGFPFLFDGETLGDDYKWNIFFYLTRGSLEGQQEKFRVLEYFYRYQRDGEETSRAIFPFISHKTAPGRSKFSFLWRVYRSETDHGKTSGHIMFIQFGEAKK